MAEPIYSPATATEVKPRWLVEITGVTPAEYYSSEAITFLGQAYTARVKDVVIGGSLGGMESGIIPPKTARITLGNVTHLSTVGFFSGKAKNYYRGATVTIKKIYVGQTDVARTYKFIVEATAMPSYDTFVMELVEGWGIYNRSDLLLPRLLIRRNTFDKVPREHLGRVVPVVYGNKLVPLIPVDPNNDIFLVGAHGTGSIAINKVHVVMDDGYLEEISLTRRIAAHDTSSQNADAPLGDVIANRWLAQGFRYLRSATITTVKLYLKKTGSPLDNLTIEIQTDSSGIPSGVPIANGTSQTVSGTTLAASYAWIEFSFATSPVISPDTPYWIVLKRSGTEDAGNYYLWGVDQSPPTYADGAFAKWNGTAWTADSTQDAIFAVYALSYIKDSTTFTGMTVLTVDRNAYIYPGGKMLPIVADVTRKDPGGATLDNAAEVLKDLVTNTTYGLGVATFTDAVDSTSWTNLKNQNYTFNCVLAEQVPWMRFFSNLFFSCRSEILVKNDKVYIVHYEPKTSIYSFNTTNILKRSLKLEETSTRSQVAKGILTYEDNLKLNENIPLEYTVDSGRVNDVSWSSMFIGIHAIAKKILAFWTRLGYLATQFVEFESTGKVLHLEEGDVVDLTHTKLGWTGADANKKLIVTDFENVGVNRNRIRARLYPDAADTTGIFYQPTDQEIPQGNDNYTGFFPPAIEAPTILEVVASLDDPLIPTQADLTITATPPPNTHDGYLVFIRENDTNDGWTPNFVTLIDSGNSTNVSKGLLTDNLKSWGLDVHKGRFLKDSRGFYFPIVSNTATTLNTASGQEVIHAGAYEIKDFPLSFEHAPVEGSARMKHTIRNRNPYSFYWIGIAAYNFYAQIQGYTLGNIDTMAAFDPFGEWSGSNYPSAASIGFDMKKFEVKWHESPDGYITQVILVWDYNINSKYAPDWFFIFLVTAADELSTTLTQGVNATETTFNVANTDKFRDPANPQPPGGSAEEDWFGYSNLTLWNSNDIHAADKNRFKLGMLNTANNTYEICNYTAKTATTFTVERGQEINTLVGNNGAQAWPIGTKVYYVPWIVDAMLDPIPGANKSFSMTMDANVTFYKAGGLWVFPIIFGVKTWFNQRTGAFMGYTRTSLIVPTLIEQII